MDMNGREYAVVAWVIIIMCAIIYNKSTRQSLPPLLFSLKNRKIITILLLSLVWVLFCTSILYCAGVWSIGNLKTTIIWFFTYALVTIFKIEKIANESYYFREQVIENLKLSAILTFILELQSFSFVVEFLLLPVITVVGIGTVVGVKRDENKKVIKLLEFIAITFTIVYFLHSFFVSLSSPTETFTLLNLMEFLTPLFLTVLYIPFIYSLYIFITYETKITPLRFFFNDDSLFKKSVILSFKYFGTNIEGLNRWVRDIRLNNIKDEEGLKSCAINTLGRMKKEKNPPEVLRENGWSPYLAKNFLIKYGISTNDYHFALDEWAASSSMHEMGGNAPFRDNVSFYVSGTEDFATRLKIRANINNHPISKKSQEYLSGLVKTLLNEAFYPDHIKEIDIFDPHATEITYGNFKISIKNEKFQSRIEGVTIELSIILL